MRIFCGKCLKDIRNPDPVAVPRDDLKGNWAEITVRCHGETARQLIDLDAMTMEVAEAIDNGWLSGIAFAEPGLLGPGGVPLKSAKALAGKEPREEDEGAT